MTYLTLPHISAPVSVFAICQAHLQLEHDYNRGGIVEARTSNRRRNASTSYQLHRMRYMPGHWWVDILAQPTEDGDPDDEAVRDVYLINVLKWGLPIDDEMRAFMRARYVPEFLATFEGSQL